MNKVEMSGRLVKDVEITTSKSGVKVGKFTLAVARKGKKDETDFIDCVVFGELGEALVKYTEKGNRLIICGSLNINNYKDKDGNNQKSLNVVCDEFYFVDFKKELTK